MSTTTYLIDIGADECTELLASTSLGRLGVVVDGRPEIFPVNHVYDHETGCVMFPTNARTKLYAALHWPWVAFEVDGIDADHSGWSVLVVGTAETVTDADVIARAERRRDVMWRSGDAVTWIRVVPSKVSGRRILASDKGFTIRLS